MQTDSQTEKGIIETWTYAGIGSRRTPEDIRSVMKKFSYRACDIPFTKTILRSGAAPGADQAFEDGVLDYLIEAGGKPEDFMEIYLPWRSFQGGRDYAKLVEPSEQAYKIAAKFHPGWQWLGRAAKMLHARNAHQILGADCETPVNFVVCWTADGSLDGTGTNAGGTGQALRIAAGNDIRVWNLARGDHLERIKTVTEV